MNTIITPHINISAEAILANAPVINGYRFCYIPVEFCVVHPLIQRDTKGHEHTIASAWDDRKCAPLTVSYHADEGKFYIVDGQHRYLAAKLAGVTRLVCRVFTDLSLSEEASLFASQTENQRKLSLRDSWRARRIAEDNDVLALDRICEEYGLCIVRSEDDANRPLVRSLNTLHKAYKANGAECVRFVFDFLTDTGWIASTEGTQQAILECLIRVWRHQLLYHLYEPEVREALVKAVSLPIHEVLACAVAKNPRGSASVALSYYMRNICDRAYNAQN